MSETADARITRLAADQHGVVSRRQLYEAGLSRQQLATRLNNGVLRKVHPNAFALRGTTNSFRALLMAAAMSVDESLASHEAAAHLHEIDCALRRRIVITVPESSTHRLIADAVHRSNYLPWRHRKLVDGIPVTSRERTLLDLAALLRVRTLGDVVETELGQERVTFARMVAEHEAFAASGRTGVVAMRHVLERCSDGMVVDASVLEARTMELICAAGVPEPVREWSPPWGAHRIGRVDFAFSESRTILEADGRKWHSRTLDFENDRRRDQLAAAQGWLVLRVTWNQIENTPGEITSVLRATIYGRTHGFEG